MKTVKIIKNIDSILQVTKDTVNQSNNYYDYIINQNNTLYKKQLPLLMKNSRMNALVLSKTKSDFQLNAIQKNKEEENNKSNTKINKFLSPLNNIRNLQIRSKKLPPLCPLFNNKGELIPSIIKSSKIKFHKLINYDDNYTNHNFGLVSQKNRSTHNIFNNKKIDSRNLKYNKSCDFDLKLDYNESENKPFNEPEYDKLKYDESKIFGKKKFYDDIIKKKIIELQNLYNQNLTTQKEKIYKYGLEKIKMCLILDSLKVKINEIKNENSLLFEKGEKTVFEYTLPFALLPLFYFKDVEKFLIIISKLIVYNEFNDTFEIAKKDDEIIANILKNCDDFSIEEDNKNYLFNNTLNLNNNNSRDLQNDNNKNNKYTKINKNLNLNDNKNFSLTYTLNNNNMNKQNSINSNDNNSNNDKTITGFNRVTVRESLPTIKKRMKIRTFDIYHNKNNSNSHSISIYEFFWMTPNKSYILTIETPLITVYIPSNKSKVKKYINYELLFYLYHTQFVMWDFYVIKYLSTYKIFRNFLEQICSIPDKRKNISFYITQPKYKKNLFTFYELTSILTRPTNRNMPQKPTPLLENNNNKNNINNVNNNNDINNNENNPEKKKTDNDDNNNIQKEPNNNNTNNANNANEEINENNDANVNLLYHSLSGKNLNAINFNSLFIQKGLLIVASYINTKKEITNEYIFHFNIDQLRKFQKMEVLVDKLSFFIKFINVNYEQETISFDFDSFNAFNENSWIKDMNKYNFKYLKQYKIIYEEKKIEENQCKEDSAMMKIFQGIKKHTQIKIEVKCPLILMKALDEYGFKNIERINIDYVVEKKLSTLTINNSLDLTRQIINILKEYNFCRPTHISKRNVRKKTNRQKPNII